MLFRPSLDSKEDSYEGSRDHEVLGRPNIPKLSCSIHKHFRVDLKMTTYWGLGCSSVVEDLPTYIRSYTWSWAQKRKGRKTGKEGRKNRTFLALVTFLLLRLNTVTKTADRRESWFGFLVLGVRVHHDDNKQQAGAGSWELWSQQEALSQGQTGSGMRLQTLKPTPSDVLPLARFLTPKVSQPLQIEPLTGDQVTKCFNA